MSIVLVYVWQILLITVSTEILAHINQLLELSWHLNKLILLPIVIDKVERADQTFISSDKGTRWPELSDRRLLRLYSRSVPMFKDISVNLVVV